MANPPLTRADLDAVAAICAQDTPDAVAVHASDGLSFGMVRALLALARAGMAADALAEAAEELLCHIFQSDLETSTARAVLRDLRSANAAFRAATSAPEPNQREYTREEMREACRTNYDAGRANLAEQVAQLREDVAQAFEDLGNRTLANRLRAISERQGAK